MARTLARSHAQIAAKQTSKDGTKKLAYRLSDGQLIESVLMPYSDGRRTACISSQAGCAMGCVFCATGQVSNHCLFVSRVGVVVDVVIVFFEYVSCEFAAEPV